MMTQKLADICALIISNTQVSNLELNKYLYMLQARFMVDNNGMPLFQDDIEAWMYGPVIKDVYDTFKHLGRNRANADSLRDLAIRSGFNGNSRNLSPEETQYILNTVNALDGVRIEDIVDYTHQSNPWREAWRNYIDYSLPRSEITRESIFDFHRRNGVRFL